jgi:hypothetical protein
MAFSLPDSGRSAATAVAQTRVLRYIAADCYRRTVDGQLGKLIFAAE